MTAPSRARYAALAITAALAVSGCTGTTAPTAGSAPPSNTLRIGLLEWRIVTSADSVTAGVDTLTVTNTGTTGHDLHVTGTGVHAHTPVLAPGSSATVTITTRPGTSLTLTCEVPGHEEAGMHATIRVTS